MKVDGLREPHPFTIASAPTADGKISFVIRALGDYTTELISQVQPGMHADVYAPYGRFERRPECTREIWIGGGVGISPFIAWMRDDRDGRFDQVTLFYFFTEGGFFLTWPFSKQWLKSAVSSLLRLAPALGRKASTDASVRSLKVSTRPHSTLPYVGQGACSMRCDEPRANTVSAVDTSATNYSLFAESAPGVVRQISGKARDAANVSFPPIADIESLFFRAWARRSRAHRRGR
jgi:hypothetical protein